MATIETLCEIRDKYNFWNEKERPYCEALSEAIRVLNAQNDKVHYAKIVRCGECRYWDGGFCDEVMDGSGTDPEWFCAGGEREVQE